jgi:hypothetical protein
MMLQCENCEFFYRDEKGRIQLRCDPFSTIKEPECLAKWQLLRQDALLQAYHATLQWQQRLAPMQEKMFEFMKREMDDLDESDSWKNQDDDEEFKEENDDDATKF